jgi:hypothetical protein
MRRHCGGLFSLAAAAAVVVLAPTAVITSNIVEDLAKLVDLHTEGHITLTDFESAKSILLVDRDKLAAKPPAKPHAGRQVFNVMDFGARGDNHTDDTNAFQAALAATSEARGGEAYVPPGFYVLVGNLTIPPGVTLRGTYSAPPSHDLWSKLPRQQSMMDGSILIPTGRRGSNGCAAEVDDLDCMAAFITIAANAAVRGVSVWYAEQETVQTPVPYPWTFRLGGVYNNYYSTNPALMDVELLGCWNCMAAVQAGRHGACVYCRRRFPLRMRLVLTPVGLKHACMRVNQQHASWVPTLLPVRPYHPLHHNTEDITLLECTAKL